MSLLNVVQILISVALVAVILLQVKGQGMGGVFGGRQHGLSPPDEAWKRPYFS